MQRRKVSKPVKGAQKGRLGVVLLCVSAAVMGYFVLGGQQAADDTDVLQRARAALRASQGACRVVVRPCTLAMWSEWLSSWLCPCLGRRRCVTRVAVVTPLLQQRLCKRRRRSTSRRCDRRSATNLKIAAATEVVVA
jgi:hypothetical protein